MALEVPPKKEIIVYAPLTAKQEAFYTTALETSNSHKEETNRTMTFLDMKIHHKDDSKIKITGYRKPTHTDQYLLWISEHPTAHKLSVVRSFYEWASIITEEEGRQEEEKTHRACTHTLPIAQMCHEQRKSQKQRK